MEVNRLSRSAALDPASYEQAKLLLGKYPETTKEENAELLLYLKTGPMLDRAMLSGLPGIQTKLDQFEGDHKREFSFSTVDYAVALALTLAILFGGYLLWDIAI